VAVFGDGRSANVTALINIMDSERANVGELFVILSTVGVLADGYRIDARPVAADKLRTSGRMAEMDHFDEVDGGFGTIPEGHGPNG